MKSTVDGMVVVVVVVVVVVWRHAVKYLLGVMSGSDRARPFSPVFLPSYSLSLYLASPSLALSFQAIPSLQLFFLWILPASLFQLPFSGSPYLLF